MILAYLRYEGEITLRRGNGDGAIFKLSGKRRRPWAVRITVGYTDEGKQLYKYIGYYEKKTAAKDALRKYLVNPNGLLDKNVTLGEVYERWEKESDIVLKNYKSAFNKCSELHRRRMSDIRIAELKDQMKNYSPTTKKMYKLLMNHLYRYAIEHEIVERNLSEFLTYKTTESKEKSVFTSDEIQTLWNNLDRHRDADIVIILLYSGLRISELLNIRCDDVHIDEDHMVGGMKTAAGKNRIIPIHWKIKSLIEKRLAAGNEYLITSPRGKKIDYGNFIRASGTWHRITTDVGVIHTAHETRHTFITRMDQLGVNKVALKKIVGHTTKSDITDHYTHKSLDELIEVMNQLEY